MVFDQHVGTRDERAENLGTGWRCGIEGKALLAGIEIEERAALFWMRDVARKRRMRAHLVASAHCFNLDDLGAHVGEHLPAHRSRHHLRELYYDQVVEGFAGQPRTSRQWDRPPLTQNSPPRE